MRLHSLSFSLAVVLFGCSVNDDTDDGADTDPAASTSASSGGQICEPGQIEACLCPGDSPSTQICLGDGSGYSECDCVGMMSATGSGGSTGPGTTNGADESTSGGPQDTEGDSSTGGPPPECDGVHPTVEGDLRFCERGFCYCEDLTVEPAFDTCYPADIAEPCCPVEVVCY